MLKLIALLCLVAVTLADTTVQRPRLDGRIVGGTSTTISNYPYQISLQLSGTHYCGGSIIGTQWVLTAAQCMESSISLYSVRAGSSTRNSGGTVYSVSNAILHANYSAETLDYDVAVVKVSNKFSNGINIQAIDLATTPPVINASAVVTGWGSTAEGGDYASTLQYVEVPIVSSTACNNLYPGKITVRMICAGFVASGGKDTCQGDSGGPLVSGGVQVGIVSWGNGCAQPNYPGVYTSVSELRSWIIAASSAPSLLRSSPYLLLIPLLLLGDLLLRSAQYSKFR